MPVHHTLILSSGGLRSLVATALVHSRAEKQRLSLLHLVDGRENAALRLRHAQRQAEHYHAGRVYELDLPHLYGHGHGKQPDGSPMGALLTPQTLITALAHAKLEQAGTVVWPIAFDADATAMARATEQIELCDHLAQTEAPDPAGEQRPRLEAPLLEMTDQQLVELGAQLDVDWTAAWTCMLAGEAPCHACLACRRRKQAFDKAGLIDPIEKRAPAHR